MRLLLTGENSVVSVMMVLANNVTMKGCDAHKLIFIFLVQIYALLLGLISDNGCCFYLYLF